jgi:hypothetical protein
MLFRVDPVGAQPIPQTTILDEALYEKDFEDWVEQAPELLGEELLIIGRQVELDDGKDRIDLLAIDKAGALVIIELKRDLLGGAADLQPLRYAALVSTWTHEQVRRHAEGYWSSTGQNRATFVQEFDEFGDEDAQVNGEQRIILAGRDLKPRLGTVALWLRKHGIDATVVTVSVFKHDNDLFLQPQVVIPVPSEQGVAGPVSVRDPEKPWKNDGPGWHLEQRLSPKGRPIAQHVVDLVADIAPAAAGPSWVQKYYVSWKCAGSHQTWLRMVTNSPHQVSLAFPTSELSTEELAAQLNWPVFDGDASLTEKLAMSSSVGHNSKGRLRLIIKSLDDITGTNEPAFAKVLRELWNESSTD